MAIILTLFISWHIVNITLTHCSPLKPYGGINLFNIGSSNGLLLDGPNPLSESVVTNHQWFLAAFGWGRFYTKYMVTSPNGNIFRVTGPLCREFTGDRWILITKASNAELWCFLCSVPEQTVEQTIETPVILEHIALSTSIFDMSLKIFNLRLRPRLPFDN